MLHSSIREVLATYAKDCPLSDSAILLAESLGKNTTFIHTHPEYILGFLERLKFTYFIYRYKQGYSVATVVGHKEFFGLDFVVNKHTLVPRPDTELLVETALQKLTPDTILIDIGTGSGCIPITVLKKYQHTIHAYATDISPAALAVAKRNSEAHKVAITFFQGNLLEPVISYLTNRPLVITANLPYLTPVQFAEEKSIQKEPYNALVGGTSGLELYEQLLEQVSHLNQQKICIFEIDPSQSDLLGAYLTKQYHSAQFEIQKDLALRDRLAVITF